MIIPFRTQYVRKFFTTIQHKKIPVSATYTQKIFVTTQIDGRMLTCIVDTGSPVTVWSAYLKLGSIKDALGTKFSDPLGRGIRGRISILDTLQIGDLEIKHVPTYALDVPKDDFAPSSTPAGVPILGSTAFAGLVLTIDYPNKELIVRPAGCEPPKSAFIYHFLWVDKDPRTGGGIPGIYGNIEGQKGLAILDTGWAGDALGLSLPMYQKILPTLRRNKIQVTAVNPQGMFGPSSGTSIHAVNWSLPGISGTSPALAVHGFGSHVDFDLGLHVLSQYRVTIDYPGSRVWLERQEEHNNQSSARPRVRIVATGKKR